MGSLLLFSGSWCTQNFVCALQDQNLSFPQYSGSPIIKSCWPAGQIPWGFPIPLSHQNLHHSGRTSLVLFSSLWVTHPGGMGFDFIVIVPLLLSCCVFFFVFGCGFLLLLLLLLLLFLVASSILLLMVVQQLGAILVLSEEEMSTGPSTPPSGIGSPVGGICSWGKDHSSG